MQLDYKLALSPQLRESLRASNSSVRRTAVEVIAWEWKKDPDIFEFLCDRAIRDPCKDRDYWLNPRLVALEAIIKQYRDRPQTLPLLQGRAENDPDEKLREFAQQKLAELKV